MSEAGVKILNIKAGTLYGYNLGIRDRYDYTAGVLSKSLFRMFLEKHGLNIYKKDFTRDLICLDFDFGSRSYEEEIDHLTKMSDRAADEPSKQRIRNILEKVEANKYAYAKRSKEEIRELFYTDGVSVKYTSAGGKGLTKTETIIHYKMLYRNSSKAKIGQVIFINSTLYDLAYDWLTMGIGLKMETEHAKIVELSAYAPLTTSTIIDTIRIPVEDILILEDQESRFQTMVNIVSAQDYEGFTRLVDEEKTQRARQKAIASGKVDICRNPVYKRVFKKIPVTRKKCIVSQENGTVKNTLWDGMGIIEESCLPSYTNGMALMRNHFFKMCGFKGCIQRFFQDWCQKTGHDYNTYKVKDMFGVWHRLRDIKIITTDNAIKWKKFIPLMGGTSLSAYKYWCDRVRADGCCWGIVKTDHPSKLGNVQQMSYQMLNTLPCTRTDVKSIAQTSIDYVESLKKDDFQFEQFLRQNANAVNHYEMMADLYAHNPNFADSAWFRTEKRKIINQYVTKLRGGKITVNADNLTICGNPYALLLYSVGENYEADPSLNYEKGAVQCYTSRFRDGEYLFAVRNPHNSPNNVCYLHNVYSSEMCIYFPFSPNILAINCIHSDIQDRANGADEDSDFFFVSNHPTLVNYARCCYEEYPTIVNHLKESGISYENRPLDYARMDNKLALSRRGIGESSNLAQLALTYYWTSQSRELYDNFIILSVLAQVIIDGCKREYEVDAFSEIDRIKNMDCMKTISDGDTQSGGLPLFMRYTKDIPAVKNGTELPYEEVRKNRDKLNSRINSNLVCPMNWLQEWLDKIQGASQENTVPTRDFVLHLEGKANDRQITKIQKLVSEYDTFIRINHDRFEEENFTTEFTETTTVFLNEIRKIKIGNPKTINRLIELSFSISETNNNPHSRKKYNSKYSRRMLNTLYQYDREQFLSNFICGTKN